LTLISNLTAFFEKGAILIAKKKNLPNPGSIQEGLGVIRKLQTVLSPFPNLNKRIGTLILRTNLRLCHEA
jgi:hypothetical protein